MSNLYLLNELEAMGITIYGKNIKITKFVNIYNGKNLILHNNIRIDDFTIISCKGTIEIFNNVHISAQCFISSATKIIIGNYNSISVGCKLFGASDDFSGEYLANPTIPEKYLNVFKADIIFKDHVLIGSNSVVLPNVILEEGTAIGCCSVVKNNTQPWKIYGGVPIKILKDRSKKCLELQIDFEKDKEIKFGIVMATFNRSNGKSITYLKRSLDSIMNQEYKNWNLILVGDKFEPENLLLDLINEYNSKLDNKIIYIKNTKVERDYITDKKILWKCAGATSMNLGLEYLRNNNYKYYCHLDDDDYWSSKHLFYLSEVYNEYSNCIFANTKSTYLKQFLPKENMKIFENNRKPLAEKTIHSSFSFRCDIIPFYYNTSFIKKGIALPSDAMMLNNIKNFIEKNNYSSIYIPQLTCYHDEERELTKK